MKNDKMENPDETFRNGTKKAEPIASVPFRTVGSAPKTVPGKDGAQGPVRRVGSVTLGVCLITAGIFFLCNSFLPNFDAQRVLEIAPAGGLILLGCEVLYFAAKPERRKYDFLSVLICLILMACCFCLSALPVVWKELGPGNRAQEERLARSYQESVYETFRKEVPEIRVRDMGCWADFYPDSENTERLTRENTEMLGLYVQLYGPYESAEAFAKDCRRLTDEVRKQELLPSTLKFVCDGVGNARNDLDTGSLQQPESYALELNGLAQLDWTEVEMAQETEVTDRLDEENPEETEPEEAEGPADRGPVADAEPEVAQ